jgi:membrane protein required for colicin V production
MDALWTLGWIDWAFIVLLLLSVALGLQRGFVFEVMSLAGWIVAWFVAQWFAPELAPHLPLGLQGSAVRHAAALGCCFVGALIVWGLLAKLVRLLVRATPLSLPDRALGGCFGLLRGGVLLLAIATVITLTPAGKSPSWRHSHGAIWLNGALQGLKPVLPEQLTQWLPA